MSAGCQAQDVLFLEVFDADCASCLLLLRLLTVMIVLFWGISVDSSESGLSNIRISVRLTIRRNHATSDLATNLRDPELLLLLKVFYLLYLLPS